MNEGLAFLHSSCLELGPKTLFAPSKQKSGLNFLLTITFEPKGNGFGPVSDNPTSRDLADVQFMFMVSSTQTGIKSPTTQRKYDIFECLSDGSVAWRDRVCGLPRTRLKIDALVSRTGKDHLVMCVPTREVVWHVCA